MSKDKDRFKSIIKTNKQPSTYNRYKRWYKSKISKRICTNKPCKDS